MIASFLNVLSPMALLYVFIGVSVGIVAGAIPGLTGGMIIALMLPMTFYMASEHAIYLLVSAYVGVVSGGLITATLLNIPGTPASLVTTFDGYPMARQGNAGRAIGLGVVASFIGMIISWIVLVLLAPPLARVALSFNHFDIFAMVVMALAFITSLSEGSFVRAMISGLLGMLLALPGLDPVSARLRLDFSLPQMGAGFPMLPVLIGLFGISQVIVDAIEIEQPVEKFRYEGTVFPSFNELMHQKRNLVRSSLIGTWIGILPGIGASIASIVSYAVAKNSSKNPERFGKGIDDGIIASEAANNASIGGALVPLITLGIPGSVVGVILLAALILHGVTPGPLLFQLYPTLAWGIITSMLVASIVMLGLMIVGTRWIAQIIDIPKLYVIPGVVVFSVVGSFAINNRMFDVWVMLGAGLLGFLMVKAKIPLGPFSIGFILAPLAEMSLRSGLMATGGDVLPLFTRPISLGFLLVALGTFVWPLMRLLRSRSIMNGIAPPQE